MPWLNADIATLDDDLETMLRASPLWRENNDLLQSAKGIGPVCPARCCWNGPSRERSHAAIASLFAWRPSIVTVGLSAARGTFGAAARMCPPWTWTSSWPRVTTHGSKPFTSGCSPQGSSKVALTACR